MADFGGGGAGGADWGGILSGAADMFGVIIQGINSAVSGGNPGGSAPTGGAGQAPVGSAPLGTGQQVAQSQAPVQAAASPSWMPIAIGAAALGLGLALLGGRRR